MPEQSQLPDYLLERYLAGELPADEMRDVEARLATEPESAARLVALEASNREILERYPAASMKLDILRRDHREKVAARVQSAPKSATWSSLWRLAPAFAVAALAVIVVLPEFGTISDTSTERMKGLAPRVLLYRQAGSGAEPVQENALAGKGDVLQVSYVAAGRTYGVILSIDGNGAVTLHTPTSPGAATRLASGGEVILPQAYELDDAPLFERFFFVAADEPFHSSVAVDAARRLAAGGAKAAKSTLELPSGFVQSSVLLRKR